MFHTLLRTRRVVPFVLLALVFTAGAALSAGAAARAAGPEDSIRMLQQAMDTRDMALVEKYLDLDGTVVKAVDVIITDQDVLRQAGQASFALGAMLAMGSDEKTVPVLRDLMQTEVREYIRHGVVSGAFAGKPQEGASTYNGIFGKAFRGGVKDKKQFGPAKIKKREKETAIVATSLAYGTKGKSYPLELRLERQQGVWRVVEIANAAELALKSRQKGSK